MVVVNVKVVKNRKKGFRQEVGNDGTFKRCGSLSCVGNGYDWEGTNGNERLAGLISDRGAYESHNFLH